jgi:carbamoyltransferase
MTAILGIHFGHDASAALIVDGRLVAAVSEERFKRIKLFRGFPEQAIAAVLREAACAPSDVDRVAVATEEMFRLLGPREVQRRLHSGIREKLERQRYIAQAVFEYFVGGRPDERKAAAEEEEARKIFFDSLAERGFAPSKVRIYDHHLCHAATAFYCSPFERSHVFTVDGRGDGACASAGRGDGWQLSVGQRVPDLHSIGMFYAAITLFLGFRSNRHEGKITGLAAYGEPEPLYGKLRKLFTVDREEKTIRLEIAGAPSFKSPDDVRRALKRLPMSLKDRINLMAQRDFDVMLYAANWYSMLHYLSDAAEGTTRENVAAAAQKVAEDVVSEWIATFVNPNDPLPATLAGGVFANVKINQKIRELPGVSNVYVQPAMGDDGLSLGAALLECVARAKETNTALPAEHERPSRMRDV